MKKPQSFVDKLKKAAAPTAKQTRRTQTAKAPPTNTQPDPRPEAVKAAAAKAPKPPKPPKRKLAQSSRERTVQSDMLGADFAVTVEFEAAAIALFERDARDEMALALIRPYAPQILASMIRGATGRGVNAVADRQGVFRLLGLPWAKSPTGPSGRGDPGEDMVLAARLGMALARAQGSAGHKSVTLDAVIVEKPAIAQASSGVERQLSDLMTVRRGLMAGRSAPPAGQDEGSPAAEGWRSSAGAGEGEGRQSQAAPAAAAPATPSPMTDLAMGGGGVSSFTPLRNSCVETGLGAYEILRVLVPEIDDGLSGENFLAPDFGSLEFQ